MNANARISSEGHWAKERKYISSAYLGNISVILTPQFDADLRLCVLGGRKMEIQMKFLP